MKAIVIIGLVVIDTIGAALESVGRTLKGRVAIRRQRDQLGHYRDGSSGYGTPPRYFGGSPRV